MLLRHCIQCITRNLCHFVHAILPDCGVLKVLGSMPEGVRLQNNITQSVRSKDCVDYVAPQVAQARNMSIGEHQHCCVTFKIQGFVWEKTYRFCNLRKWKDFNKKQLTLLKMCVTSLLCGPRADLWLFYGFLCKRFSLYIKVNLFFIEILSFS